MRMHIIAAMLILAGTAAFAQQPPVRPSKPAPAATAVFEEREAWCQQYAAWVIAHQPQEGPTPTDVRASHRFELETTSCKPDPRAYERQTLAEIVHAPVRS